jgi:hypothetical protein
MILQTERKTIILIASILVLSVAGVAGMRQLSRARKADNSWGARFRVQPQSDNVHLYSGPAHLRRGPSLERDFDRPAGSITRRYRWETRIFR